MAHYPYASLCAILVILISSKNTKETVQLRKQLKADLAAEKKLGGNSLCFAGSRQEGKAQNESSRVW